MKEPPYRQAFQPRAEGGTTYAVLRQPSTRYGQYSVAISQLLYPVSQGLSISRYSTLGSSGVIFCLYLRKGEAEALCKRSISNQSPRGQAVGA